MKKLYFITTNQGKIKTLQVCFEQFNIDVEIEGLKLPLIEPQADTVREVSRNKAQQAYEHLKQPVIVEDGGFCIDALGGFPGVYTRYVLDTIGADGILKLMKHEKNRQCCFVSTATFVDENGELHSFDRQGGCGLLAYEKSAVRSPKMWSDVWLIYYHPKFKKVLSELTDEELFERDTLSKSENSLVAFTKWFASGKM